MAAADSIVWDDEQAPDTGIVWDTPAVHKRPSLAEQALAVNAANDAGVPRHSADVRPSEVLKAAAGLGEAGLQAVTSVPTLVSKGLAGARGMLNNGRAGMSQTQDEIAAAPDFTYQPRTDAGKAISGALAVPGEAINALAMARTQGPLSAGGNSPLALSRGGIQIPVSESPENSARMGAGGAVVGNAAMAIPGGVGLTRAVASLGNPLRADLVAGNVIRKLAGTEEQRPAQIEALRSAGQPDVMAAAIPNSGPTAAQALVNTPEGTALQGLQQSVARSPDRGVSVDFAKRIAAQRQLLEQAKTERDTITAPLRDAALSNATAINKGALNAAVTDIAAGPESAVATTRTFLNGVRGDIVNARGAEDLYAIRKRINDLLSSKLESDQVAVRGSTVPLTKMKQAIDTAIENGGGGKDWQAYLNEYSARSKPIKALDASLDTMYKPEQRTSVGADAGETGGATAPHVFSRTASLVNYGLGLRRALMGSKVTRQIGDTMLNPSALADVLENKQAPASISGPVSFASLLAARLRQQQDQEQQ